MTIPIIIISYTGATQRTVDSIRQHTREGDYSIIIQSAQQSVPANVNAGFRGVGDAPWFVLFNDDWVVSGPGWLEALLSQTKPDLAYVSARFDVPDGRRQYGYFISENGICGPMWGTKTTDYSKTPNFYGHPVIINSKVFKSLGGYDEGYVGSQYADLDFILRVHRAGYKTAFSDVNLFHYFNESKVTSGVKRRSRATNEKRFRAKFGFGRRKMGEEPRRRRRDF